MSFEIFNSLSKKKEEFKPLEENEVKMYVCGPTVYGPGHIGHAKTYTAFDIIRRYLEYSGFKVKFVVNLTDVHDDMISKANEQGITIFELAEKNIKLFFKDMDELGIKKADINPRVTETIPEIIELVKTLQEKGFAYETEDGVYFNVQKFKDYGKLAGIKIEKTLTGTRVKTDKYDKENVQDFALWKKQKLGEPFWESPWGRGRPGWHIECSAMSKKHLGEQIDIHGGAVDLIFPHHQNEIAQSEAASGKKPFVKYWLHSGFLNVEGEKMSKSLGNYIEIPKLLEKYDPKVFRFFVAGIHYRSPIDFTDSAMQIAKKTLEKLNDFIRRMHEIQNEKNNSKIIELITETRKKFIKEMNEDFNTPNAWATIFDFVSTINKFEAENNLSKKDAEQVMDFMKELDTIFKVFNFEQKNELDKEVEELIQKREEFRKQKKFSEADEIRAQLTAKGIQLLDTPEGVKWKKIS